MPGEEVAIIAIIFGSILSIVFLGIVGSLIKTWIKNKNAPEDLTKNKEFLSALRDFKEKTERRISNLEAIVTEEREGVRSKKPAEELNENRKEHTESLGIEIDDDSGEKQNESSGNLRNMLNQ